MERQIKRVYSLDQLDYLNELLRRVSQGETIQITRRGVPMAKLIPPDAGAKPDVRSLATAIRTLRKGATLGKTTIRELIDEGRRY